MSLRALFVAAAIALATPLAAQQHDPPNGLFLVAKPGLVDPNFRETVVLVTQARDGNTVGVIINRPTTHKLARFLRDNAATGRYRDAVFFGGPVMQQSIVSLFRAEQVPEAPAYHVLKGLYMSMHPDNVRRVLEGRSNRYRLYAGFSGWVPNQLQSEMQRDGWYVLPADVETIFRSNMNGLWHELVQRAERQRVAWQGAHKRKAPPQAGL